jgi:hypothetical protein
MTPGEDEEQREPVSQKANRVGSAGRSQSISVPRVVIGAHFKMIWITITGLTIMLTVVDILMSILIKHPTASAQQAIAMCDTFAKVGYGAIFGMIGTKALG